MLIPSCVKLELVVRPDGAVAETFAALERHEGPEALVVVPLRLPGVGDEPAVSGRSLPARCLFHRRLWTMRPFPLSLMPGDAARAARPSPTGRIPRAVDRRL